MSTPGLFMSTAHSFAARQHGVVSKRQLLEAGVGPSTIGSRLARGYLHPALRGVYGVGRPELTEHGLWMAAVLATGPNSALAGPTAAAAWGFMRHTSPVQVARLRGKYRARSQIVANGHRSRALVVGRRFSAFEPRWLSAIEGIPILTVEVTLLQLAGELGSEEFKFAFWEADRKDLIDDEGLFDCLSLCQGRRGGREFVRLATDRIPNIEELRSLLETLLLDLILSEGLPDPEVNRNTEGYVLDFRWPDQKLIVETDGYEFHRGREAFERDRRISNELRAAGWTVLRFTYRMIKNQPDQVLRLIRQALETKSDAT
jgi:very-short-patch-repair endonuclease